MSYALYFDDDRSGSYDLSSTPEGSIPTTTTTSTEAVSCCERLKLQKGPWVSFFQKNTIRFILAGLFLLIQLASITCRLVLHFLYYRVMFSIFSAVSGIISFTILWAFVPESPPYLASKGGIPLYKQKKEGDDIDRYVQ